jgi:hypothetical protein
VSCGRIAIRRLRLDLDAPRAQAIHQARARRSTRLDPTTASDLRRAIGDTASRRYGMRVTRALVMVAVVANGCGSDKDGNDGGGGGGGGTGGTATKWYETCGDPVCRPGDAGTAPAGVAKCTTEKAGQPCAQKDVRCDPGQGCGVLLVCADRDPRMQPGGCPISRRAFKTDLRYLDAGDLDRLEAQVRALRLATYRYRDAPERQRLGFVIDDAPGSPAVDEGRDMIDLYAYTSMVVGALQRQLARQEAQQQELERLRAEVRLRCPAHAPSSRRSPR